MPAVPPPEIETHTVQVPPQPLHLTRLSSFGLGVFFSGGLLLALNYFYALWFSIQLAQTGYGDGADIWIWAAATAAASGLALGLLGGLLLWRGHSGLKAGTLLASVILVLLMAPATLYLASVSMSGEPWLAIAAVSILMIACHSFGPLLLRGLLPAAAVVAADLFSLLLLFAWAVWDMDVEARLLLLSFSVHAVLSAAVSLLMAQRGKSAGAWALAALLFGPITLAVLRYRHDYYPRVIHLGAR